MALAAIYGSATYTKTKNNKKIKLREHFWDFVCRLLKVSFPFCSWESLFYLLAAAIKQITTGVVPRRYWWSLQGVTLCCTSTPPLPVPGLQTKKIIKSLSNPWQYWLSLQGITLCCTNLPPLPGLQRKVSSKFLVKNSARSNSLDHSSHFAWNH